MKPISMIVKMKWKLSMYYVPIFVKDLNLLEVVRSVEKAKKFAGLITLNQHMEGQLLFI
jgi:hypothetical protein